ncbi:hypothetical protein LCGC14_3124530, partial [marine sediment metagenome]
MKILNDVIDNYDLESKAANTIFQHKEKIINDFLDNLIYKKVDTGFNKWKSEELNSVDDWSTNQVRTSRYSTIGNDKD